MAKYISLFGGTTTDTTVQVVKENQIVIGFGPYSTTNRYVVYKVEHTADGYMYHMIDLDTKEIRYTDILQPLSCQYGIGKYYDDANPQFMDAFEVALLVEEAEKQAAEEARQAEQERQRVECVKAVGRERFAALLPPTAKAVIVAELRQDESDHMTDYFAYRTVRTVILGFSSHTRDLFSEMRKHASNFPETAYLAEPCEEYEHREKYSMGAGYYLGQSKYYGWIIHKSPIYNRERTIDDFAYIAGDEANIRLSNATAERSDKRPETVVQGDFVIVDYSDKAIAVFGDTKPIKTELSALGGRFNSRLTHEGEKKAGWIFQKSKEEQVRRLIGMNE